ncbi:hypothetical protein [Emticicia sp. 17c]|uniref:hypothetical protein n=1 Tax=Emticicia sp. 17c TaxID=3127704 RepID=UPI00301E303F
MKKLLLLVCLLAIQKAFAQNTFPTSGNVGIGTSTPAYLLDVNSATQRLYNPSNSATFRIEGNGTAAYAGSYIYLSAGMPRSGDTFTKARIDANRGVDSTTSFQFARMNDETYTGLFYRYDDVVGHRFMTVASRTATSTGEAMRIMHGGVVGINTTAAYGSAKLSVGGTITSSMGGVFGYNIGASNVGVEIGGGRIADGSSYLDLVGDATYTDYGFRAIRTGTANGGSTLSHRGTGNFDISTNEAAPIRFITTGASRMVVDPDGFIGIPTPYTGYSLRLNKALSGAATTLAIMNDGVIQTDVTTAARYYQANFNVAASVNLPQLVGYYVSKGTWGTGSTVSEQSGFWVSSSMAGATNNYAFRGSLAAGTGQWNLFMHGTANNYLGGRLGLNSTALADRTVHIGLPISGAASSFGVLNNGAVQSDVSSAAYLNYSQLNTQATDFTLPNAVHFIAAEGTIGAGSAVTTQTGFWVANNMVSASNNYAFRGSVPVGTGRWNLYMDGSANNYINGRLGIGTNSIPNSNLALSLPLTGGTNANAIFQVATVKSDVTSTASFNNTYASTEAASFTLGNLIHYSAGQGTIGAGSTVTNQYGFFVAASLTGATNNYGIYSSIASGTGRWNLYMAGNANNYLSGNVGIGTTTPTARLDVRGTTSTDAQTNPLINARGAKTSFEFGHPNAAGYVSTIGANYTNGRPFLCFNCEAGTTNDTYKTRGITGTMITPDLSGGLLFGRVANSNADNQALTVDMTLKNGQLGIGTSTIPTGYKLAVAGDMIVEKVKVRKQASGWPDYVFSPEYKLPSLDEVEKFTKQNSHLPEIPSAKEIEKEGQDLGEMNRLLLKKVEELTLYMIELKKQSDKQSTLIEQQSAEIEKLKANQKKK